MLLEAIKDCYYTQHVDKPTRSRGQKANILDLIITDEPDRIDEIDYQSPLGRSDHSVLIFKYKVHTVLNTNHRILYCYDRGDYEAMSTDLAMKTGLEF